MSESTRSFKKLKPRPLERSLAGRARFAATLISDYVSSWATAARRRDSWQDVERFCLFVGYPNSGHSLFGSLLDAHPEMVISRELDALKYVDAHFSRNQLYALILERSEEFADFGERTNLYDYSLPGQFQGRFTKLRVIGDKKGGLTSLRLKESTDVLHKLEKMAGVPLALIHMMRNPYDIIATRVKRGRENMDIAWHASRFFEFCEGVTAARAFAGADRWFEIRHEDVIGNPRDSLARACHFLGVGASESFLSAASERLYTSPSKTRTTVEWPTGLIEDVAARIELYPFLRGYSFES